MEPELGPRKLAVLRAVVEEFVRSGEPVGSERIAERSGLGVSPATIRNELAALEELGFLTHAHTSSGRLPTDLGYRRYVDAMRGSGRLRDAQRRAIAGFFADTMLDLEHVLRGTTQLLSRLTQYAGLALPPAEDEEAILRVELLDTGGSLLLLVVGQRGSVDKATIDRPAGADKATVEAIDRRLAGAFRGLARTDAQALALRMAGEAAGVERDVLLVVADALGEEERDARSHIVIGGAANLADEEARLRRETLRRLFEAFERESELRRLLRDVTVDDVSVTIGAEHPQTGEWEAALVAAPFRAGTTALGTIGVVGPTAMDYATVVASVREVARHLSELATALDR
ncbi:MAG: heat-inducible transcriptional repressor HrcA [Actinomycetota bacterium]